MTKSKERAAKAVYLSVYEQIKDHYPAVFADKANPKPLALGTFDELQANHIHIPEEQLSTFLGLWVYRREYRVAMLIQSHRYDLYGNVSEEIDATHKAGALHALKRAMRNILLDDLRYFFSILPEEITSELASELPNRVRPHMVGVGTWSRRKRKGLEHAKRIANLRQQQPAELVQ